MNNWTIAKRITLGGTVLCALLTLVGIIAWISLAGVRRDAEFIRTDVMPGLTLSSTFMAEQSQNFARSLMRAQARNEAERAEWDREMAAGSAKIDQAFKSYEATMTTDVDRRLYGELEGLRQKFRDARTHYENLMKTQQTAAAVATLQEELYPAYNAYLGQCEKIFALNAGNGERVSSGIRTNTVRSSQIIIVATFVALVIGGCLGWIIVRGTGVVLRNVTEQLHAAAEQTAAAAAQLSASSQSLAQGSSEQAASLEETSASLEEIGSMTKRNADAAGQAKDLANQTRHAADRGAVDVGEMNQAMTNLQQSSANIAKIVETIDAIAFQTNILALNAAVEAARAGEAGAGFAVVAEEVRALAQRSAQSAKETAAQIEDSVKRSASGVQISRKVADSFAEIVTKARKVDELVAEIATGSNEQNRGIAQVNGAVTQMDKVTQTNAAGAEEAASAAEELSAQAEATRASVLSLRRLVDGAGKVEAAAATQPPSTLKKLVRPKAGAPRTREAATSV